LAIAPTKKVLIEWNGLIEKITLKFGFHELSLIENYEFRAKSFLKTGQDCRKKSFFSLQSRA